jgi:hypothetical protein
MGSDWTVTLPPDHGGASFLSLRSFFVFLEKEKKEKE